MLLRYIKNQTAFLLRQREAGIAFLLLIILMLVNYMENVFSFRGYDVTKMYSLHKLSLLSYNKTNFQSDTMMLFVMLFPFLVVLPAGFSYIKEHYTGEEVYMTLRLGKRPYFIGKLIASFLTAMLLFTVPFLLELGLQMLSFPWEAGRDFTNIPLYGKEYEEMVKGYLLSDLYIASPMLHHLVSILLFGMYAGILSMFTVAFSIAIPVKTRAILFLPVFLLLSMVNSIHSLFQGISFSTCWYEYFMMYTEKEKSMGYLAGMILLLLFCVVFGYWYGKKEERF